MIQWVRAIAGTVRAGEWWDHKLVPVLAVFYGTLLGQGMSIFASAGAALALIGAIAAAATFVSLINDWADRFVDRAAGKVNRLVDRSRRSAVLLVAAPLAVGAAFLAAWRNHPPLALCYAGIWVAFSLYSPPPFRLKVRGLAGVACDAAGAHLFPSLVALLLAAQTAGRSIDLWWTASVALWSLAYGARGIIWHQLGDVGNDRRTAVASFAVRSTPRRAAAFGATIVFPVEAVALAAMLMRLGMVPVVFLVIYALLLALRVRWLGTRPLIVSPADGGWAMMLQEYYELFLPVSILCASALAHPLDWLVLLGQLALFPRRGLGALAQMRALVRHARPFLRAVP